MRAVELRGVSKQFWVSHEKPALVRNLIPRLVQPVQREPFLALHEVNLELAAGTALGVFGPNGSGKTTLLSLLVGITPPTTGTVRVQGRTAPLLSLGSGFHPELTGLENIFLNGSLLGLTTREIRQKRDTIVAFSQLDGFIDAPLQTYSAGMKLRLGFAIAIHTDFDVLLIDELMSVGDAAFQAKCLEKLQAFKRAGKTLIIAAHSPDLLRPLVDRALLLHQGRIIADGTVDHVQERYATLTHWLRSTQEPLVAAARDTLDSQVARHDPRAVANGWGRRLGSGEAQLESVRFVDADGHLMNTLDSGAPLTVAVRFSVHSPLKDPHVGIAIFRGNRTYCYGPNTRLDGLQLRTLSAGAYECRLYIGALTLTPGSYHVTVAIWDATERSPYDNHVAVYPLQIRGASARGVVLFDHTWRVLPSLHPDVARPQLVPEGPSGRQAWYRTFEPLTFTIKLPAPSGPGVPMLHAECLGPRDEVWWSSRWSPPSLGAISHRASAYQLHIPELPLLTGRYRWSIGWEPSPGMPPSERSTTATINVVADRGDHGIVYLPHHWEVSR